MQVKFLYKLDFVGFLRKRFRLEREYVECGTQSTLKRLAP